MKKLTRKLFLSVAALAACCATLVSTTFAWYVNNPTATIGPNTEGNTATSEAQGSISVSANGTQWTKSLSTTARIGQGMIPTSSADAKTFKNIDGSTTNSYIDYMFYLKSEGDVETMYVSYNLTNSTTEFKTQTSYVDGSTHDTGLEAGDAFVKDAGGALRIAAGTAETSTTGAIAASPETIKFGDPVKALESAASYSITNNTVAGLIESSTGEGDTTHGNAHKYYEALNGEGTIPDGMDTELHTKGSLTLTDVTAETVYIVVFRVWLEGTDIDCYNSCAGQTFTIDFTLSLSAPATEGTQE